MKGEALGLRKGRKEKEKPGPAFEGRIPNELRKGLDQDSLTLLELGGSLGNAGKNQLGFGQLKGACSWTQGTKVGVSH